MMTPSPPRQVILVYSASPRLEATTRDIGGRSVVHATVKAPPSPLPTRSTTIATGVSPLVHNVLNDRVVDETTLEIRPVQARDCRFPTIWNSASQAGLSAACFDWPATHGDDALAVESLSPVTISQHARTLKRPELRDLVRASVDQSHDHRARLGKALAQTLKRTAITTDAAVAALEQASPPAFLAMVFRWFRHDAINPEAAAAMAAESFMRVVDTAAEDAILVVVQEEAGSLRMSVIGADDPTAPCPPLTARAVASAVRTTLALPLPFGTPPFDWSKYGLPLDAAVPSILPVNATERKAGLVALAQWVANLSEDVEPKKTPRAKIVRQNATQALRIARGELNWAVVAESARANVLLEATPNDHWLLVLALQRLQRDEELSEAAFVFAAAFPDIPASIVGQALAVVKRDPREALALIEGIDVEQIKLGDVLGALGRLFIRCGERARGLEILRQTLDRGATIATDRVLLATELRSEGDAAAALEILGPVGASSQTGLKARLLRGQIMLDLNRRDDAVEVATQILEDYPAEAAADTLLAKAKKLPLAL